jgi:hypothetical protein
VPPMLSSHWLLTKLRASPRKIAATAAEERF